MAIVMRRGASGHDVKIKTRMNLVLAGIGAAAIAVSSGLLWGYLDAKSIEDVRRDAETQMRTAEAIRSYTVEHVQAVVVNKDAPDSAFHREAVPAYAAVTTLSYLYRSMNGYSYREVAINPTSLQNLAAGWSADIVDEFRRQNSPPQILKVTGEGSAKVMHFARPIRVQSIKCLQCHGEPSTAPASMRTIYGTRNGFGWHVDEVIGAQIVSIPLSVQAAQRNESFLLYLAGTTGMLLLVMATVNLVMSRSVLQPIEAANRSLKRLASVDGLTGAVNKQYFNAALAKRVAQAAESGEDLALVLIDLDHFKRVNDVFGHPVGDKVLRETAERVRRRIRRVDTFGRLGGEEFGVLCPQTDAAGAMVTADHVLKELSRAPFGSVGKLTASLGVTQLKPGDSVATLMERADQALYEAKHSGRNRVVLRS